MPLRPTEHIGIDSDLLIPLSMLQWQAGRDNAERCLDRDGHCYPITDRGAPTRDQRQDYVFVRLEQRGLGSTGRLIGLLPSEIGPFGEVLAVEREARTHALEQQCGRDRPHD
jgi:hypothetical protein